MALMDFIKKQFIDIIEWTEDGDGVLAWRFPMEDREIQNGGSLTVRESQMAVFVNEGKVADVFGPGRYTLTTATLPVLTYLQNWDKLFKSPFKSDVYFFSTRQQIDQRWGTTQPVTIRDKDFGAVRLRAFGNYAYRIVDPRLFYTEISGTREQIHGLRPRRPAARPDAAAHLRCRRRERHAVPRPRRQPGRVRQCAAGSDRAGVRQARPEARDGDDAERLAARGAAEDPRPEDRHGHGRRHGQVHAVPDRAVDPAFAAGAGGGEGGGIVGGAVGLGAGVALGQTFANQLEPGPETPPRPARRRGGGRRRGGVKPEEVMATIEPLADFKAKGILTQEEFDAKKAELLKKLA